MKLQTNTKYNDLEKSENLRYMDNLSDKTRKSENTVDMLGNALLVLIIFPLITSAFLTKYFTTIPNLYVYLAIVLLVLPLFVILYTSSKKYTYAGIVYDTNQDTFVNYTVGYQMPYLHDLSDIRKITATLYEKENEASLVLKLRISNPKMMDKILDKPYRKLSITISIDDYVYIKQKLKKDYPDNYSFY